MYVYKLQNKAKSGKSTASSCYNSKGSDNGTRASMDRVLKDIGTVQLRKIARS